MPPPAEIELIVTPDGADFIAQVNIAGVTGLKGSQIDFHFGGKEVKVKGIADGLISGNPMPALAQRFIGGSDKFLRVLSNLPPATVVNGAGILVKVRFQPILPGQPIVNMAKISLFNIEGKKIPHHRSGQP